MYHLQVILSYTAQTNRRAGEKVRGIALLRCPRAVLSFFRLPLDITQLLLQDSPAYISEFDPRCRHTGRLERRVFASDCCQGSHWCILVMKTIRNIYRHNRIAPLGDNISTALHLNDLKGLPALFTGVSCLFSPSFAGLQSRRHLLKKQLPSAQLLSSRFVPTSRPLMLAL